jgi:glutamate--cysteine ligase
MTGPDKLAGPVVTDKSELVGYLASGCTAPEDWRIGTEHEKHGFRFDDFRPLTYDGPQGIGAMLDSLLRFGWNPVYEGDNVIALAMDDQSVSLEPGGQFELSGAPVANLHQTCAEVHSHLAQVNAVGDELGVGFVGVGFQPKWQRGDIPIMPKGRYDIMRAYMPTRGNLGLDMMLRSATVQVNLDFLDEADMVTKMRVGLALQPIATALFANSPFTEGKPNGFMSFRSHIWTDTDPDRCGILPFVFDGDMSFERYVDHALDVPMYFVNRDGEYLDASGQSFRDFLGGTLPALPGERPTLDDWENHLTTLFPEVRLKRYIEMRGADSGPWDAICGLPALWVGLLYDSGVLEEAWQMVKDWTIEEHEHLRREVPRHGFRAEHRGRTVLEIAKDVMALSRKGLARRAILSGNGQDETHYLDSLDEITARGFTPAEGLLDAYHNEWNGNIDALFKDCMY